MAGYHSTAVAPAVDPKFCSRSIHIRVLPSVENPSLTSCSLSVNVHLALDRCTATAFVLTLLLIAVLLLLCSRTTLHISFLTFYTFHCVFFFKSSPFFPVIGNIDPDVVVLILSFKWFLNLSFVRVLFEEIIDVIFPSFL